MRTLLAVFVLLAATGCSLSNPADKHHRAIDQGRERIAGSAAARLGVPPPDRCQD